MLSRTFVIVRVFVGLRNDIRQHHTHSVHCVVSGASTLTRCTIKFQVRFTIGLGSCFSYSQNHGCHRQPPSSKYLGYRLSQVKLDIYSNFQSSNNRQMCGHHRLTLGARFHTHALQPPLQPQILRTCPQKIKYFRRWLNNPVQPPRPNVHVQVSHAAFSACVVFVKTRVHLVQLITIGAGITIDTHDYNLKTDIICSLFISFALRYTLALRTFYELIIKNRSRRLGGTIRYHIICINGQYTFDELCGQIHDRIARRA